jgi:all-trans-retinol 13,14-reductase
VSELEHQPSEMRREIPPKADAVVIGAGLGGLTCALELARQGLDVCVLEQHRIAGGYVHGFRRKGYHFDVSLHHLGSMEPGGMAHGVLYSLGVFDKLKVDRREHLFHAEFPELEAALPNPPGPLAEELVRLFPSEREGIEALLDYTTRLKKDIFGPTLDPDFDVPMEERLMLEWVDETFGGLLERFVSDRRLRALLAQLWLYIGLPPGRSTATFSTCVFGGSFLDGSFHVVGGGMALVRSMVERLRELGGECFTRAPVSRVEAADGGVRGVRLEDGGSIEAQIVVSGVNPFRTFFELLPTGAVSEVFAHRLRRMEPSLSMYSMYVGLDCPPSELGIPAGNSFHNYSVDQEEGYQRTLRGEIDRTDWCLTSYQCESDSAMYPPGGGIVSLAELTPGADWIGMDDDLYRERKARTRERLLAKIRGRYPDIESHLEVLELATPRTMYRYTGNHQGAVYGLAQTVEQSNRRRLRNRTPLEGLYLTGAWTWAGGGYEGAMMTGVQTAQAVLSALDRPRAADPIRLHPRAAAPEVAPRPPGSDGGGEPRRFSAPDDEHFRFRLPVRVYGDELNSRGFVDASSYLRYLDRGRTEAIESICKGLDEQSWLEEYVVNVYRIDARCATVTGLSDRLEVRSGLRRTSSHRAAFDQRVVKVASGEMVVDAVVEVLFLDQERKLVPVPHGVASESDDGDESNDWSQPRQAQSIDDDQLPYRARFRVYYEDTDAQGIAYHVSYARYCERALFDLARTLWPEIPTQAWMSRFRAGVASIDVRYLNASRLGDWLEVRYGVVDFSSHRLTFGMRIVLEGTGKVVADATTDVEFRDEHERLVPVPRQFIDLSLGDMNGGKR